MKYIYLLVFIIAYVLLQNFMFYSNDTCWLVSASQHLLSGGSYARNFLETNPPLILYILAIPNLLTSQLHIPMMYSLNILAVICVVWGFYLNQSQLKLLFKDQRLIILLALGAVLLQFFFTGAVSIERESLYAIFTIPYLFQAMNLAEQKMPSKSLRWLTNITASIGFCLKPYFIVTFILVELYLFYRAKKHQQHYYYQSLITLLCFGALYLTSIAIFTPSYYSVVLPMVFKYYFGAYHFPLKEIFSANISYIGFFMIALVFLTKPKDSKSSIFILGFIGYGASYFWQMKPWFYHQIPINECACLYALYIIYNNRQQLKDSVTLLTTAIAGCVILSSLLVSANLMNFYIKTKHNPNSYYYKLINIASTHHAHTMLTLSYLLGYYGCTAIYNPSIKPVDTSPGYWTMMSLIRHHDTKGIQQLAKTINHQIITRKPDLLLIDNNQYYATLVKPKFYWQQFFLTNPAFSSTKNQYRYVSSIGNFKLYVRKNPANRSQVKISRTKPKP